MKEAAKWGGLSFVNFNARRDDDRAPSGSDGHDLGPIENDGRPAMTVAAPYEHD